MSGGGEPGKLGQIGLALSGGGARATAFHFGVLARIAEDDLLESVSMISSVSGGSLAAGLIFQTNGGVWPTSEQYKNQIMPELRGTLTTSTLQWSAAWRSIVLPWRLLRGRAHVLAHVLKTQWGIKDSLRQLPESPRWIINATCFESGKNWRFSKPRMGDYITNYVVNPDFPIADAIAASAAVPGLIGPLNLRTAEHDWHAYQGDGQLEPVLPSEKCFGLWDGGVYDNLGLEALHKPNGGIRSGIDFLVVSDATSQFRFSLRRRWPKPGHRAFRLVDIAIDQTRALRARSVVADFQRYPDQGVYLRLGNTSEAIYKAAQRDSPQGPSLNADTVNEVATFGTTLRRLRPSEFELLTRHGFEVADATLCSRQCARFTHRPYPANERKRDFEKYFKRIPSKKIIGRVNKVAAVKQLREPDEL